MRTLLMVSALGSSLAACDQANNATFEQCELDLGLEASSAAPGATIVATGGPLSDALDTVVRVDGVEATVEEVTRDESCDDCTTCRATTEGCGVCTTCDACASACEACVESLSFVVPAVEAGEVGIIVTNSFGVSPTLPLQVVAGPDE